MPVVINDFEITPDPPPERGAESGAEQQKPAAVSPREVALAVERGLERRLRVEAD